MSRPNYKKLSSFYFVGILRLGSNTGLAEVQGCTCLVTSQQDRS